MFIMLNVVSHKVCLRMISTLMHHTTSQIREGIKIQCFHGFRGYEKREIYFKKVIASLKKALCIFKYLFLFFFSLKIKF